MKAWDSGIEIVECVTSAGIVDMHNDSTLLRSALTCEPMPVFSLEFLEGRRRKEFALQFFHVQELSFRQDTLTFGTDLWDPREVSTFLGLEYMMTGDLFAFTVRSIVGDYDFRCAGVNFRWRDPEVPVTAHPDF